MKKSILPVKLLTLLQNIICVVILFAIAFISLGPIFTAKIDKSDKAVEIYNGIIDTLDENNENAEKPEMPEMVEISAPYVIKSIGSIGPIIKGAIKSAKSVTDSANKISNSVDNINNATQTPNNITSQEDLENIQQAQNDIQNSANDIQEGLDELDKSKSEISETLKSQEFVNFIALIVVIANAFSQNILLGFVYLILIVLAFVLPFYATIRGIIALVSLLKNIGDQGKAHSTISKCYRAVFEMFPTLWLMKIIAPAVEFSSGIKLMVGLLIAGLVLSLIASRLKAYTPVQFKYVNLLQGMSVVAIIGYFIFMLNIGGMDMFGHIWDAFPTFVKNVEIQDWILPAIMILVIISLLETACKYVSRIACRLACMVPAPKTIAGRPVEFAKDNYIVSAAASLGLIIAPIVLMVTDFKLDLGDDMGTFVVFSLGVAIMFIAELLMLILKKSLCRGLTSEDVHAVLTGCPTGDSVATDATEAVKADQATAVEDNAVAEEQVSDTVEEQNAETVEEQATETVISEEQAEEAATEEQVSEAEASDDEAPKAEENTDFEAKTDN